MQLRSPETTDDVFRKLYQKHLLTDENVEEQFLNYFFKSFMRNIPNHKNHWNKSNIFGYKTKSTKANWERLKFWVQTALRSMILYNESIQQQQQQQQHQQKQQQPKTQQNRSKMKWKQYQHNWQQHNKRTTDSRNQMTAEQAKRKNLNIK